LHIQKIHRTGAVQASKKSGSRVPLRLKKGTLVHHRVGMYSTCRDSADTQYMLIQTNFSKSPKQLTYKPL